MNKPSALRGGRLVNGVRRRRARLLLEIQALWRRGVWDIGDPFMLRPDEYILVNKRGERV